MKQSKPEMEFALHCRAHQLNPAQEFKFHEYRKWRFDFCFPADMLAIEIEGGVWSGGRHTRGAGFTADMEKYNAATLQGWRVLRFTPAMVSSGEAIQMVKRALGDAHRE